MATWLTTPTPARAIAPRTLKTRLHRLWAITTRCRPTARLITAENNSSTGGGPGGGPPTEAGLVAYWKLDENTGVTAADSSGCSDTGTLTNGPTWTTGQTGAALTFDGVDDKVANNGISDVTNNFTISFWAQPTGIHEIDAESTSGLGGTSGQKYALWPGFFSGGHAGAGISVGTNGVSVYEHTVDYMPATLVYSGTLSGWTHITIVYENKQPKLYLNGSLVRTGLTSAMSAVHINPADIGGEVYGYYGGKLDEFRVYNRALSATEVATLPNGSGSSESYTASTDFSNAQGFHNWYYVDENDTLMTYDAGNTVWVGTEGPFQWLWATGGHPGSNHDVVRQWRAPQSGSIHITGSVADGDPGGGDGVVATIRKGSQILWQQTIANGNTTGVSYDLTTTVHQADRISFSINRNGSASWDSTSFNPTIVFTPGNVGGQIYWLVADHLGTPRMIFDQSGSLETVRRHDYLPFGEELFGGTQQNPGAGGRTVDQGYQSGDGVRQQFTSKERDTETGLDYFGARYFASMQGRFTGADPFDINLGRQNTFDPDEAEALFRNYIQQPQHWNHYSYALNNPLRYVDPDGMYEYETELLGQKIKVHVDDSIIKTDKDALNRIKDNLQKAFDKINSGATKLTADQIESIHSQNRIYVSNDNPVGTVGGTFHITQRMAENPNIDELAGDIVHDSRHSEQLARGLSYSEANGITMEQEASQFTVDVMNNTGGWDADVFKGYQDDAKTGHLPSGMKDKTTLKSRAKVLEVMSRPQKRRK